MYREALELPEVERAELGAFLLGSLDPAPEAAVEAAWEEVAERRWREIESGSVQTIPWEEVKAKLDRRR